MKSIIKIISLISIVCPSSISLNGFGSQDTWVDPAALGLGHSLLFSGRPDGVVQSAMSTQYKSPLSKIYISNAYNQISILNTINSVHSISSISFSFPFQNVNFFSIGLLPKTRTDFSIIEPHFEFISGNNDLDPLAVKHLYELSGGISNFYIGFSSGYFEKIDLGFRWDILFGNLFSDVTTNTYTFNYNNENCIQNSDGSYANDACINMYPNSSLITNNRYNFNGHSLTIDGRTKLSFHEFAASITLDAKLDVTKSILNNSLIGTSEIESLRKFSFGELSSGYKFENLSGSGFIIEFQRNLSSYNVLKDQLFETKEPTSNSIHGGLFTRFRNSKVSFWNSLSVRGGFMLKIVIFGEQTREFVISNLPARKRIP